MCVKLMKNEEITIYDQNKPLKEQLQGCTQILFDGKYDVREVEHFFHQMAIASDIDILKFTKIVSANFKNAEAIIDDLSTLCNRELIGK